MRQGARFTNFAATSYGDEELLKELVYRHGQVYTTVAVKKAFKVRYLIRMRV